MLATSTFRNGNSHVTYYYEAGDCFASDIGTTRALGSITKDGVAQTCAVTLRKNFRFFPTSTLAVGWTYEYVSALTVLFLAILGQSNQEGRGDETGVAAPVNAERMSPNTYPYDENPSGPGPPNVVGPAVFFADALLSDPRCSYDRICIVCTATGNQTLADLFGTDGSNGNFATQAGDRDVLGGPITSLEPCLIQPGDEYLIWAGPGEADASSGTTTGWAAEWTELYDYVRDTYLDGATCLGAIVHVMGDTAAGGATQPRQDIVVAEQESLNAPTATPPRWTIKYEDSDRQPGDLIHYTSEGHELRAGIVAETVLASGALL